MLFKMVVANQAPKSKRTTLFLYPSPLSAPLPMCLYVPAGKFLEMVRQQLSQDFSEMRSVSSENLLYIKEDLIIPHVRNLASRRRNFSLELSISLVRTSLCVRTVQTQST